MPRYAKLWPDILSDYGVPICGDRVIMQAGVGYIHMRWDQPQKSNFKLGAAPKGALSSDSIKAIFVNNVRGMCEIVRECGFRSVPLEDNGSLRLRVKNLLENYRSALDYIARDIAAKCTRKPKGKLYFPIARAGELEEDFKNRLASDYPNLDASAPNLFAYLVKIQHYHEEPWLQEFGKHVNRLKHSELTTWDTVRCVGVGIHCEGIGFRVGELGLKGIEIGENTGIKIFPSPGRCYAIRGPDSITVSTTRLADADKEILVEKREWNTFGIPGAKVSLSHYLLELDMNIRRVCTNITGCLSDPTWQGT
jgi:hypothetical protein